MRKSFVTWRLSFLSLPTEQQLEAVKGLLGPIARVDLPSDHSFIAREYGLSDYLFIEPETELTAGELALHCLTKAHRLGKGWSVMWQEVAKKVGVGWLSQDIVRAAFPDCLDGLTGSLTADAYFARCFLPEIQSAFFTVSVTDETVQQPVQVKEKPRQTEPIPSIKTEGSPYFNSHVKPALAQLLMFYSKMQWQWDAEGARAQLERLSYRFVEEGYEQIVFSDSYGMTVRIATEDDKVRWIEFILSAYPEPRLLDENEYTAKQNEYEALFHDSAQFVETILGAPQFIGASGDDGFPVDQWADWAAVWHKNEQRIMVQQKQNDPELPLELCLVFAPALD
jgi:hypothetical protein